MNLFLPAIFTVEVIFAYVIRGQELAENYVPFVAHTGAAKMPTPNCVGHIDRRRERS